MAVLLWGACAGAGAPGQAPPTAPPTTLALPPAASPLPAPSTVGTVSLEEVLAARRSVREYSSAELSPAELGQLLWAAQGITEVAGRGRTAPSAGGTYPLEVYAVTRGGLFRYVPEEHALEVLGAEDLRPALAAAAGGQEWVAEAALVVVVVGVAERTAARYGERAERYVALEAGHAAQNLLLQAVALGLGAVPVGAFADDAVRQVVGIAEDWAPLYLIPVGHPAAG